MKRIPIEFYKHFKEYEDELLNLKFENLNIVIICAGIPYGGCETIFNYFLKVLGYKIQLNFLIMMKDKILFLLFILKI